MSIFRVGSVLLAIAVVVISCSSPAPSGPSPVGTAPDATGATASVESGVTSGTMNATPSSAVVRFGIPDANPGKGPGHPSDHAPDTLVPGTVVIDQGGTVTFDIPRFSPHQVSIYGPGKRPQDVDASNLVAMPAGCPNNPAIGLGRIADPDLLVQAYTQPCTPPAVPITHTFPEPGRYLVICSFNPHFQIGMYGWVIVRERGPK